MYESLYKELIKEHLPTLVLAWENTYNGQNKENPLFLVDELANRQYSVDGTFSSIDVDNVVPMAYVMDMDSSKPFLTPDNPTFVSGEIPKVGAEMKFSEKKLSDIHTLNLQLNSTQGDARKSIETALVGKLFKPMKTLYLSQKERWDFMLKQALSTGKTTIDPSNNVGSNIVLDYGYKEENKFNADTVWGTAGSDPLKDISKMVKKARKDKKKIVQFIMMQEQFDAILNSDQAKTLMFPTNANAKEIAYLDATAFRQVFLSNFGASIKIVENTEIAQKNGSNLPVEAWKVGTIVGVTTLKPATLVWSRLAEDLDRVEGASYQTIEECIMLRKYKQAYPTYGEFDSSESRSLVVVAADSYTLDTTAVA